MRKKITALCPVIALSLALTACAGKSETNETGSGASSKLTDAATKPEETEKESKKNSEKEHVTEVGTEPATEDVTEPVTEEDNTKDPEDISVKELSKEEKAKVINGLLCGLGIGVINNNVSDYFVSFNQKYKIGYENDNADESEIFKIDYLASGSAVMSFDPIEGDEYPGLYDYIKNGDGFLQTEQDEMVNFYSKDVDKHFDDEINEMKESYETNSRVLLRADGEDVSALGMRVYYDFIDADNSFVDQFNGKIKKEALLENMSGDYADRIKEKLLYMDTWEYIDEISDMALEMLNDMDLDDEKVLDKFIEDNGIIVDVDDDGHTVITFNLDTTEILKKWTESDAEDAPRLSGAVTIDMEGAKIINYEYDLSSYFKYMLKQSFGEDAFTTLEVEIFSVIGGSLDYKPYMISAVNEFIEYGDDKAADFIADFDEHVLSDIVDA